MLLEMPFTVLPTALRVMRATRVLLPLLAVPLLLLPLLLLLVVLMVVVMVLLMMFTLLAILVVAHIMKTPWTMFRGTVTR